MHASEEFKFMRKRVRTTIRDHSPLPRLQFVRLWETRSTVLRVRRSWLFVSPVPRSRSERDRAIINFVGVAVTCSCRRVLFYRQLLQQKADIHSSFGGPLHQRLSYNREKDLRCDTLAMFRVLPDVVRGVSCTIASFREKCVYVVRWIKNPNIPWSVIKALYKLNVLLLSALQ